MPPKRGGGPPQFQDDTLIIDGLGAVQRAFRKAGKDVRKDLRDALRDSADPVKFSAQVLAITRISHMSAPWSEMRVGVTSKLVYMVPKQRGRLTKRNPQRYRRPNMGQLLMDKAMEPALTANVGQIEERAIGAMVGVAKKWQVTP